MYFAAHAAELRRTAYLLAGNWHDAEDLVQATFVRLFAVWPRVRAESAHAYVRRALVNVFLSSRRGGRRFREPPVAELPDNPSPVGTTQDDRMVMAAALRSLTLGQRAAVVLRFWQGMSVAETAEALGGVRRHRDDTDLSWAGRTSAASGGTPAAGGGDLTVDSTVRDDLERCLPETEPPMRLRLEDVIRRGRRRRRMLTLSPAGAAAVVVVLMIGSVVVAAEPPPPAEIAPSPPTPIGTTSVPTTAPNSGVTTVPQQPTGDKQPTATPSGTPSRSMPPGVPALPGTPGTTAPDSGAPSTTSPLPPAPLYEFRAPAGHKVDWAAQNISEFTVNSMPPGHKVNLYYGTKSDAKDGGGREAYGGHLLWQDGNTYGYLFWMHRTDGYFPITEYGLPAEPCVDPNRPAQGETCVIRPRTEDTGIDVLFDVNRGYRLRGVLEHRKVSPGGPDIAVTFGFYLPSPGGDWPQFPNLVGQRPLADIPYTAEQLRQVLHP